MIKSVKWDNHAIIGSLELNFTKADGTPYPTIVLAGENGIGKTTILETLAAFLNLRSFEPFEHITYEADGGVYTAYKGNAHNFSFGFHCRRNESDGSEIMVNTGEHNNKAQISTDLEDIRHYGCSYSKARSGFVTKQIKATQTSQLDGDRYEMDDNDDFTRIKQLLVDVRQQDSEEWATISDSGGAMTRQQFNANSRMERFKNAFEGFFDTIRFSRIEDTPEEKKILFLKNGREIPVDSLSTGEKQIVFRGAHLLKNLNGLDNGIVLIDEPELSMHPKWQDRILKYYCDLFKNKGTQRTQIIFATHSESVLRAALEDSNNTLVIVLGEKNGTIVQHRIDHPAGVLPRVTAAETSFLAFGIYSIDYHIELYSYLQSKICATSIKGCDQYIELQPEYIPTQHEVVRAFRNTTYYTLPTFVRNRIDHPDPNDDFNQKQLETSIDLLIKLCA